MIDLAPISSRLRRDWAGFGGESETPPLHWLCWNRWTAPIPILTAVLAFFQGKALPVRQDRALRGLEEAPSDAFPVYGDFRELACVILVADLWEN